MRSLNLIFPLLFIVCACDNENAEKNIESSLFPLIKQQSVNGNLSCSPSFVKLREEELSIFCSSVDTTDKLMVESLREDTTKVARDWVSKSDFEIKHIRTRFIDEITVPVKK